MVDVKETNQQCNNFRRLCMILTPLNKFAILRFIHDNGEK